jgi:hypothetical protein
VFKISPIQDKKLQKDYADACGTNFYPELFAYSMINQETGELMGISQFDISCECGYIKSLRPRIGYSDFEAMFILGRATMNFIDLCGNHKCKASRDSADERLLKAIGFSINEAGEYFADMSHMFDGHCDGHPVNLDEK